MITVIKKEEFYKKLKPVVIVGGGYFGDEAKGKIVDTLLKRKGTSFVVRTNSGANAGHTVVTKAGKKIVTHLAPSGVAHPLIKNLIGPNCFLDPMGFFYSEVQDLMANGMSLKNLRIDNTFVVTPYHILDDLLRGLASTGKGMTQVAKDKVSKIDLRLEDLINQDREKIEKNFVHWQQYFDTYKLEKELLEKCGQRIPPWLRPFLASPKDMRVTWYMKEFAKISSFYKERFESTGEVVLKELARKKYGVLEGAQSFFLSNDIPTHHLSSTASGTHALGTLASFPIQDLSSIDVISVLKVPSSRVGLGVNPSGLVAQDWFEKNSITSESLSGMNFPLHRIYEEFINAIDRHGIFHNGRSTNVSLGTKKLLLNEALAIAQSLAFGEFGATTKRPRVTGFLDLLHLKHLVSIQ